VEYPKITVTGGEPGTADRVANTVNDRLNAMIDVFARGAIDVEGVPVEQLFDSIAGDSRTTSPTWGRYLSVVLDESTNLGGAHPNNRSIGLVFDTRTGDRVQPSDIFSDLDAASSVVRAALVRSRAGTPGPVTAQDVAAVSLRPGDDGTTTPLTWYPTDEGLGVVVDQDSVVAYVLGPIEATVPWAQFAGLLRPGVSP
jgi:hypothetical protein